MATCLDVWAGGGHRREEIELFPFFGEGGGARARWMPSRQAKVPKAVITVGFL